MYTIHLLYLQYKLAPVLKYAAKFPANISNNYGLIEINKLQIDERKSG